MRTFNRPAVWALALSLLAFCGTATAKDVVGWIERVAIYPGKLLIKAKIDTGAKNSSLHCDCISPFDRDGEKWVGFTVENDKGQKIRLERKVHRTALVKRAGEDDQERMVILLGICLDRTYREAEVTLVDRSAMNYPMLIGRTFLEGEFVVDPDATFTTKPRCKNTPGIE
jgi:hypothetical protein